MWAGTPGRVSRQGEWVAKVKRILWGQWVMELVPMKLGKEEYVEGTFKGRACRKACAWKVARAGLTMA